MTITFDDFKIACKYTGDNWKDGDCCNHKTYGYEGELSDDGYVMRSTQPCLRNSCPLLNVADAYLDALHSAKGYD